MINLLPGHAEDGGPAWIPLVVVLEGILRLSHVPGWCPVPTQLHHPLPQPMEEERAQQTQALPGAGSTRGCEERAGGEGFVSQCKPQTCPLLCARWAPLLVWGHLPRNTLRSNPCFIIWDLISTEVSSFFIYFFPLPLLRQRRVATQ